ncbi:MAG: hypothetical protein A3F68_01960 [Acidobacteria bacterium RIFCSPLOWO2_12_FULL_54_10]|nr:MAG: hypothetical protein A3F68_01960 [Acidobacteria bacterium RIFCSPLOWO2_12_FULL_54_10]
MPGVIQICMQNQEYAVQLAKHLEADAAFGECHIVTCIPGNSPCKNDVQVQVVDSPTLLNIHHDADCQSRTILIVSEPVNWEQVWEKGVVSIIRENEPLEYAKLAIYAALLRKGKPAWPQKKLSERNI